MENVRIMVVESNHMVNALIKDVMMFCVNRDIMTFFKDDDAISYMEKSGIIPDIVISRFKDDAVNGEKIKGFIDEKSDNVVFVFSSEMEKDREKVIGSDGQGSFLQIPFSINDLFKIVDDFIVNDKFE